MRHDAIDDDLLRPEEVAATTGRSVAWVWRQVRLGRLRPVRVLGRTRFRSADVEELAAPVDDDR